MLVGAVSYVDDCRDNVASTTHLIGETGGYLAVFRRPRTQPTVSRRCPWTLTVNPGRRLNITWRVFPTAVRYAQRGGVAAPQPDGRRRSRDDGQPCSLMLSFFEAGHEPVNWTCRAQDSGPVDRFAQVV